MLYDEMLAQKVNIVTRSTKLLTDFCGYKYLHVFKMTK